MSLGLLLLLPAFLLGMVGGGDVKSLAVAGIFTGPHLLWVSFLRGAAIGGLAGLTVLAARRYRPPAGGKQESGEGTAWTLPYAGILLLCIAVSALLGPLGGHPQPL
jgi:prepilin peptidase CpaA